MNWWKTYLPKPSNNTTLDLDKEDIMPNDGSLYTVGITDDGFTVLKLHNNNATTTLTLNAYGVKQLIKLLAVTIEDSDGENTQAQD